MVIQSYGIAVGWNQTPVNVETLTPSGAQASWKLGGRWGNAYFAVHGLPRLRDGRQLTLGGTSTAMASTVKQWAIWGNIDALAWFFNIYEADSTNLGRVSINTTVRSTTYVAYNATLITSEWADATYRYRRGTMWLDALILTFTLDSTI